MKLINITAIVFFAFTLNSNASAASGQIAIIMSNHQNLASSILNQVRLGITPNLDNNINTLYLTPMSTNEDINTWLHKADYAAIIALGQQAYEQLNRLEISIPVIYGAVKLIPSDLNIHSSAISAIYDPSVVMMNLITLASNIKRIHVVYSKEDNAWLIELAEAAARERGIQLVKYESDSIKSSSLHYRTLLETELNKDDAVWLLNDRTVNIKALLPELLKEAWSEMFILFSNSPTHVKNGVLFSAYPDMNGIGVRLANITKDILKNPGKQHIEPIKNLNMAINTRTADHLHIDYRTMLDQFQIVFPSRQ